MSDHQPLQELNSGKRLVSLDVFRGGTIAAMILVNNPGSWDHMYAPLQHADWHGWTITDLIFPFFLFIVGVSIVLAFTRQISQGVPGSVMVKRITTRSLIIFGIGLLLNGYPYFTLEPSFGLHNHLIDLRVMGVLQRIAICYLVASLMFLYVKPKVMARIIAGILLFYWAAMTLIPVPGFGAGMIDNPEANLTAWLDRIILTRSHIWSGSTYDPEGLFSTLPAIATTLLGVMAGNILFSDRNTIEKTTRILLWGFLLVTLGYVWDWVFPINKPLWTSSYAVFTAGLGMMVFGACYWLIDIKGYQHYTRPLVAYGVNPLVVFYMSGIVGRTLGLIQIPVAGDRVPLQAAIFENIFLPLASPINASLMYSIVWVIAWYLVLSYLYKKKIFVKV